MSLCSRGRAISAIYQLRGSCPECSHWLLFEPRKIVLSLYNKAKSGQAVKCLGDLSSEWGFQLDEFLQNQQGKKLLDS